MKDNTHPQVLRKKLLKLEIFIRRPLQALFFLTAIWLPHVQFRDFIERTVPLTQC